MIDRWFIDDINGALCNCGRAVVTDAHEKGKFLLDFLPDDVVLLEIASTDLAEIKAKYEAETHHADDKVVFYTHRSEKDLTFLLEYAETAKCIVLDDMEAYIKQHLFEAIQINPDLSKGELLIAAKLSKGKDLNWWKAVAMGLNKPMDTHQLLLNLLASPEQTAQNMDKDVWRLFTTEVFGLIGKPYTEQPAKILAQTVMNAICDGLISRQITPELLSIYNSCVSSHAMDEVMADYIARYDKLDDINPLMAHVDHPFVALDNILFKRLSEAIENSEFLGEYIHFIDARTKSKNADSYKAGWLRDVQTLVELKNGELYKIASLSDFAIYYRDIFAKLDTAVRHLYAAWLHEEKVLRPFQFLYEQAEKELLDKWFSLTADYQPTQQGLLKEKMEENGRIAFLVCDGLRLEIAETIYQQSKSKSKNDYGFAMLPSVTENGMSALFGCDGVETTAQNRYAHLKKMMPDVEVIEADKLNSCVTARHLVLLFGDVDQVGEKKQLAGLKDINHYEEEIAEKIETLLGMGYNRVYVTADHGFVITGILDEADKVPIPKGDVLRQGERFCLANDVLTSSTKTQLIPRQDSFMGSEYQFYAQSDKPFRTRGNYGYAHGGFTPQECIIPIYEFSKDTCVEALRVSIDNKDELKGVGEKYFKLKLKAEASLDTFKQERRVEIHLYADGKEKSMQIATIKQGQMLDNNEFETPSSGKLKVVLVDAGTKQQIDFCEVKLSSSRDQDDLF